MATKTAKKSGYDTGSLSGDLAKAKSLTSGMDTSRISSAGTADKLARASKAGTRTGSPTANLDAEIGAPFDLGPSQPMAETPAPIAAPIQEAPQFPSTPTAMEGFQAAQASGLPAPQTAGEARSALTQFQPSGTQFYKPSPTSEQVYAYVNGQRKPVSYDEYITMGGKADFSNVQQGIPDSAVMEEQLAQDPMYNQLLQTYQQFNDVVNQRQSLTQEYDALSKKLGIDSINTELMNMKNVIEGTEDDLRTEITKAGGFATESQVQALTMARNKQLVKNYNNLLDTKQQAMETLNTMIGLAAQDRQFAMQAIGQKLQIDQQIMSYRDKMRDNAQNAMNKIAEQYGYSALITGDPWQDALTEKTLGLGRGGLQTLANSMSIQQQQWQQSFGLQQAQFGLDMAQSGFTMDENGNFVPNPQIPQAVEWKDLNGDGIMEAIDQWGKPIGSYGDTQAQNGTEALRTQDQVNSINRLMQHKGLTGAVGAITTGRSTGWSNLFGLLKPGGPDASRMTGDQQDFIASTENIIKQLTLNTFQEAKQKGATFGAMTEGEWKILGGVATKLSQYRIEKNGKVVGYSASEKDFVNELNKINNFAKFGYIRQGGNPDDVGVPKQPDGTYWLNIAGKMQNVTPQNPTNQQYGPTFNQAGTASSANQVKGMQQTRQPIPLIKLDSGSNKVAPLTQVFPKGSIGGQCGTWVRSIVERQGLTYPRVGDSLAEKTATARKYGVPISQARPGSVVLTGENKTNGHVAYVIGRNQNGFVVAESNYGLNGKVDYGRTIPFNKVLGIINPVKKYS